MHLYNTLSGKKEELENTGKRVNLFVCGPTVYDYQHIGNGKTQLVFDLFVRYLRSEGYKVFYLQNITDIDDKIIKRANESGVSWDKLADDYLKIYLEDIKNLGIKSVTKYARATRYIKQIVKQVKTLLEKGYAYKAADGYYFNIAKFADYGKLSRRTIEQAEDGVSRIDDSTEKINKGDFCLWKLHVDDPYLAEVSKGEPYWNTPLGKGRPGWHIEDTAITEKFFGPQYDIHGGGLDLKFPHHEAELAQQEAASGLKPFVRFWMHSGLVSINGQKMSKSLGNFITIRDFLKKCSPEIFRYIVLMHHYRSPINYSDELQYQADQSIKNIKEFVAKLNLVKSKNAGKKMSGNVEVFSLVRDTAGKFRKAMDDDFNTPNALAAIFEFLTLMQTKIWSFSSQDSVLVKKLIVGKFEIFGFKIEPENVPNNVMKIARERERVKSNKQFTDSDALRREIEGLGYRVEDTPLGQLILKN